WYGRAAAHLTTFYGQLAATRLGPIADAALPPEPTPADAEATAFAAREVPRVVRRLVAIGEPQRIDPFVLRLTEGAEKPEQMVLPARLAREAGRTDLAVPVARRAFRNGVTLIDAGYPMLSQVTSHAPASNNAAAGGAPEPALVHALVRQESNFAP